MPHKRIRIALGVLLLLIVTGLFVVAWNEHKERVSEEPAGPPFPPVTMSIVYQCDPTRWEHVATGTAHYTFTNDRWPWDVTLSFPPICYYRYGSNYQDLPFPNDASELPDFARQQRDVIIPAGESVSFTAPFGMLWTGDRPDRREAFVFGLPSVSSKHPVVGTIYGTGEFRKTANGQ